MTKDHPGTAELLDKCEKWVRRYVVLSIEQCAIIAAWILHTYAIERAECTPYLHITSPEKGCGKSRLLETLELVVCRPCKTGGMTAAALVRTMDAESPTLLLDEFDAAVAADRDYSEAVRGILNEGFRRGGNFRKVEGKNHQLKTFKVFGAKAIAGIGKIQDTVASRSIAIELRRKTPAEVAEPFRQRQVRAASTPVAELLQVWTASAEVQSLSDAIPLLPDELSDRQKDISEPLVAIADLAGGEWPDKLRRALVILFVSARSDHDSSGVMLLCDIRSIFEEREKGGPRMKGMHSADLASSLCKLEGRPWAEWGNGQGMNADRLAKQLKKYRIWPQAIRLNGANQRGYSRHWFEDAWLRYCPLPLSASSGVTPVTTRMEPNGTPVVGAVTGPFSAQVAETLKLAPCRVVTP